MRRPPAEAEGRYKPPIYKSPVGRGQLQAGRIFICRLAAGGGWAQTQNTGFVLCHSKHCCLHLHYTQISKEINIGEDKKERFYQS